ncbi:kinase [Trichoderma arundinaceum]|uniref:Kinase n=1 Tax=Trichoderma arundinaceum TaxID=490622 RepID=A0A395ND99_TRIAR|nr:kinase [Trichoderma arundinaceum]
MHSRIICCLANASSRQSNCSRQPSLTSMAEASSPAAPSASSAAKRPREDSEATKSRLQDQQFHIGESLTSSSRTPLGSTDRRDPLRAGRYADPLVPRKTSDPQFWPKDVTPEMEKEWLAMIKEHRSS